MTVRIGSQVPRLESLPQGIANTDAGDEVIEFSRRFGLVLDEWQQHVVRYMCAERVDGSWAATQTVLLVPRQSGKSAILEAIEMAALFLWDEMHIIYSAHLGKTATDHMRRIRRHIDSNPDFKKQARVLTGKGDERVERHDNGAILEFITRGKKTARGGSPSRVIFDEAMFLTDDQIAAMLPAMSAQSMNIEAAAQMAYFSSAPIAESEVLHRLRDRAINDRPARTYFAEWSTEADCDPASLDGWYQANPGLGIRISEEWVTDNEFGTLSPEDFGVERLGIPQSLAAASVGPIDLVAWGRCADSESMPIPDTVRLCLDAPPDLSGASFAVAGRRGDGLVHISRRATADRQQVVPYAVRLCKEHGAKLIIPSNSPARAWRGELLEAGVELDELTSAEYAEACGSMLVHVSSGSLRHRDQPEMNAAVEGLAGRSSGDVDIWSRRSSKVNIAPFVAATCALVRVPEKAERALTPMFAAT